MGGWREEGVVLVSVYHVTLPCVQVGKKIGQGQFSVVYRAKNVVDGQIVALKKIQASKHTLHMSQSHLWSSYLCTALFGFGLLFMSGGPICFLLQIFDMVDAKARQDCIKEIDLLKQLNHPNVIKYLSSFIENNEVRKKG